MAAPAIAGNNPLLNPTQSLSGKSMLQAAQGLVDAQTAGPLAELAKQIAANNAQSQTAINQTGGYFHQLGQQAQQAVGTTGQVGDALNSKLQGIGQDEQQQLHGIGDNAMSSLLKYAPQSDSSNSLAAPALQSLATEIARQQGLAAQNQGAFQSFGATQGANYHGLAASNLGTFGLKGQEALRGIAQAGQLKNEPLMGKVANIQAARGSDLVSALGKVRQQEIANRISQAGLGLKAADIQAQVGNNIRTTQTQAANNANTVAATVRGQNLTESSKAAGLSETTRHDQAMEALNAAKQAWTQAHPKGSNPNQTGLNFNQQQGKYTALDRMSDVVKALKANGSTPGQIWRFMTLGGQFSNAHGNFKSPGYPSWAVQAAYDLAVYGYINKGDAAQLAKNGMTRSGYYTVK